MIHEFPTSAEITDAIRELLEVEVMPAVGRDLRYKVGIAIKLLGVQAREFEFGAHDDAAHSARLEAFGIRDDAELAAKIRARELGPETPGLLELLLSQTRVRLRVSSPGSVLG